MQSSVELTDGLEKLEAILKEAPPESAHWNEAQNRFQFIDRLLLECLGWSRPDIRVEERDEFGEKSDYLMGLPVKAVLEAKREAITFGNLPSGKASHVRKLAPLIKASKELKDAAQQVLNYCTIQGSQIAILCNGPQLVLFQALTPGTRPLEGECFFFNGFKSYIENFTLLWELISPEGILENRASRLLASHRNPRIPQTAASYLAEPRQFRYRNEFQENLREMSSLLLEEIEDNPELKSPFYKNCYVPIEANNRHILLSKNIIQARYKRLSDNGIAPSALDASTKASKEDGLVFSEPFLLGGSSSKPVVIIGDVGVGKSSFFENLYEQLDQDEKAATYFLKIDLGTKANLSDDVKSFILSEIPDALNRDYDVDIFKSEFVESIYFKQIQDFDKSVKGKLKEIDPKTYQAERLTFLTNLVDRKDNHLHASLGHLAKGRSKNIVLIIDNADQRTFDVQQEAFLIAQELASTRNLIVFVALRPSTFFHSKTTGALSGYQNKILTISPPPADEVVKRRLAFALNIASGKISPATLSKIRLNLSSVVSLLEATLRSIRSNAEIQMFLSNITGGNTRAVIELITGFLGSPNVDSKKIVTIEEEKGNYKVPLHEFSKHALLGEYTYFNPQSSFVACNIYDVSFADSREHFLGNLIISYLSSNQGIRDNDGFIGGDQVVSEMQKNGFIEDQITQRLKSLASKRLIETPEAFYRELPVEDFISAEQFVYRATSIGIYHVKHWAGEFSFLDAVSIDTPIFDEGTRENITKKVASLDIKERLARATLFKTYLENQWFSANITATYYDLIESLKVGEDSFQKVERFLNRR